MEKFTFFWKDRSPFSQWYPCKFTAEVWVMNGFGKIHFTRAEQYMMYQKAALFGDLDIAYKIMLTDNPAEQKELGRKVKNFDATKWNMEARDIVLCGNLAKFSQNEKLKQALLSTAGTTLVEASPYDKIWGIGLLESDPRSQSRETWLGKNWLGQTLTDVREKLINGS